MQNSIESPLPPHASIARENLDELTQRALDFPVTLISAPGGYGKSVLLEQLHRQLIALDKIAIDLGSCRAMSDEQTLLRRIVFSLPRPGAGDIDAQGNAPAEGFDGIVRAAANADIIFMLDDIDALNAPPAHWLQRLMEATRESARWIVACRGNGHFAWARRDLYGTLHRVEREQLACTRGELRALATRIGVHALDDVVLESVIAECEGWWPGAELALSTFAPKQNRGENRHAILSDYFEEEVLRFWSGPQRESMTRLAILQEVFPDIAQSLAPEFDAAQLRHFEHAGQFVFRAKKTRADIWRLHAELRAFLTQRLAAHNPAELTALHQRACEWFDARGRGIEAVHHAAQTGNTALLADTLEKYGEALHYGGLGWRMDEYAASLPEETLSQMPLTLMMLTWLRIRSQHFHEARALLAKTERYLAQLEARGETVATDRLSLLLRHRRVILAYAEDKLATAETSARELIPVFENDHLASTLYAPIIAARSERLEFDDFDELRIAAHNLIDRADYRVAHVSLDAVIGTVMIELGRAEKAEEMLTSALRIASQLAGTGSGMAALPAMPLSRLHYEMNDLPFARQLIDRHLPRIGDMGLTDQLIEGYLTKARLLAVDNLDAAHSVLDEGLAHALPSGSDRLAVALLGERVKLLLDDGQPGLAEELRERCGVGRHAAAVKPSGGVSALAGNRAVIWTRLALAAGNAAEGLAVATQWRRACQQRHAVLFTLRWSILIVRAHLALDNLREAQRELRQAVALAMPGKFSRRFLDEGDSLRSLLAMTFTSAESSNPHDAFALRICREAGLVQACAPADISEAAQPSKVTGRETEILHLAAGGLHNWEIGNQLGLTEGTVKWHLQNIYDKLGARRRSQAVDIARSFGILPR